MNSRLQDIYIKILTKNFYYLSGDEDVIILTSEDGKEFWLNISKTSFWNYVYEIAMNDSHTIDTIRYESFKKICAEVENVRGKQNGPK